MKNVYVMMGVPGSGKSTYLKKAKEVLPGIEVISRDEIRFSIVQPGEEYFSHEKEVVKELWKRINETIKEGRDVFIDQTSLTKKSRKYLLEHISGYESISIIWVQASLETCLERNELRKGTRAYVPRGQIHRMYSQLEEPSFDEGFDSIFYYDSEKNIIEGKVKE